MEEHTPELFATRTHCYNISRKACCPFCESDDVELVNPKHEELDAAIICHDCGCVYSLSEATPRIAQAVIDALSDILMPLYNSKNLGPYPK